MQKKMVYDGWIRIETEAAKKRQRRLNFIICETLAENISPYFLEKALNTTVFRFPGFRMSRKGEFDFKVRLEDRTISLEIYNSLTSEKDAMRFLMSMTSEYLRTQRKLEEPDMLPYIQEFPRLRVK